MTNDQTNVGGASEDEQWQAIFDWVQAWHDAGFTAQQFLDAFRRHVSPLHARSEEFLATGRVKEGWVDGHDNIIRRLLDLLVAGNTAAEAYRELGAWVSNPNHEFRR